MSPSILIMIGIALLYLVITGRAAKVVSVMLGRT